MRPYFTPMPIRYVPYQTPPMMNRFFMPPNIPMSPPMPPPGVAGAIGAAGAAGAPSSLNFNQLFNQAGQLMQSAQKYGPMLQQARPMLKNLPALWRMYKGFISSPSEDQERPARSSRSSSRERDRSEERSRSERRSSEYKTQPSLPKIYQPTFQSFD